MLLAVVRLPCDVLASVLEARAAIFHIFDA